MSGEEREEVELIARQLDLLARPRNTTARYQSLARPDGALASRRTAAGRPTSLIGKTSSARRAR
jgi:hypothetical protein